MRTPRGILTLVAAAAVVAACSDSSQPSSSSPTLPPTGAAKVPEACSTADLAKPARDFFSNPEQRDAADALKAMEVHCAEGNAGLAVAGGWGVLTLMETALEAGSAGAAADGADLANGLIDYMCGLDAGLCDLQPDLVSASDLGPQGMFAVRMGGADPVVARGKVPFNDFLGQPNAALWGLEALTDWATATTVPQILFYGSPGSTGAISIDERSFGDLAYDLHTFPDVERFNDGQLLVASCYDSEVELPHPGGNLAEPALGERMQREGTILQPRAPNCAAWQTILAGESLASRITDGARRFASWALQPQPLFAAFFNDRRAASVGGTPIDFSTFAPVAAERRGYLEFKEPPNGDFPNGTAGVAFEPIEVMAYSGNGTPMELVFVELYVAGNEGDPAGATFCDPDVDTGSVEGCDVFGDDIYTEEQPDGQDPVAVFDGVTLYKAGGFRICARAVDNFRGGIDFTFEEACSGLFNLKNGNK